MRMAKNRQTSEQCATVKKKRPPPKNSNAEGQFQVKNDSKRGQAQIANGKRQCRPSKQRKTAKTLKITLKHAETREQMRASPSEGPRASNACSRPGKRCREQTEIAKQR